ncbi:hypothetical protein FDP41_007675 [Naegleria fowleri]|uniref:Cyclin-like domain-containing protein n=1 Tax=Naegleria fowleri TaxID=5763 RepID=A0A6A5CDW3_NAEFO|nr:uncharacterized protein FDP41_007675 [Naegleria fowleri]KAF0983760.1 hypothetical protein FDP41_007675 [Naegleria fowleri]CAG4719639.1 unnamed protein product [Naegleria fowleri]
MQSTTTGRGSGTTTTTTTRSNVEDGKNDDGEDKYPNVSRTHHDKENQRESDFIMKEMIKLIRKMCFMLELSPITSCTALYYFHYYCLKFVEREEYDVTLIACACVFLACKTEEQVRRVRDVINCMWKVLNPESEPLELWHDELFNLKDSVIGYESVMMRCLKFRLTVNHPFKYILGYCGALQGFNNFKVENYFVQFCFQLAHKAYDTVCCVKYNCYEIAASMIFLAAQLLDIKELLPNEDELSTAQLCDENTKPQWFTVFNVDYRTILEITSQVREVI